MGCQQSIPIVPIQYKSVLPNTMDAEHGLGGIYRRPGFEKHFISTYDEKVKSLFDNFMFGYNCYPSGCCLGWRPIVDGEAGDYQWITYTETLDRIEKYARALINHDLLAVTDGAVKRSDGKPIQTIGHFCRNCPEVEIAQFGTWRVNGTVVPLYETLGPEAVAQIIKEMELKTIVCSVSNALSILMNYDRFTEYLVGLKNIIITDSITEDLKKLAQMQSITLLPFNDLINEESSVSLDDYPVPIEKDICMICYTSGTASTPKGAILSHENMVSLGTCIKSYIETIGGFTNEDCHLSYLPMAHVFEHFCQFAIFCYGGRIGFSQGVTAKVVDDISHLHPTFFPSVPRLFTRIVNTVLSTTENMGILTPLVQYAIKQKLLNLHTKNTVTHPFFDQLIFSKIRAKVGFDRLRFMVSGSAPLSSEYMDYLRIFFCCPVIQGLGLTETAGGICCSFFQDNSTSGHCGGVIQCAEARLISVPEMAYLVTDQWHDREVAEDGTVLKEGIRCEGRGEVCFRGYNVIQGYYKRPEINEVAFDKDGWFHSGDIAMWLPNGALQIIDRKKDIFKLAQGEYISPDRVSSAYMLSPLLDNIFVYGDSFHSYLTAIVVPNQQALTECLAARGMEEASLPFSEMCLKPSVVNVVLEEMDKISKQSDLMGFEKVKKIYLESEPWTMENNMITATMKLKRYVSAQRYKDVISQLYGETTMKDSGKMTI